MTTVVVGVGNRLRGDDAVGPMVIDELAGSDGLALIDAGSAPENHLEPIVRLKPGLVVFVDACDFRGSPGEFREFGREELDRLAGGLVSTHTLPLTMTVVLLGQQVEAEIALLGIQPERLDFNAGLSEPVRAALPRVADYLRRRVGGR